MAVAFTKLPLLAVSVLCLSAHAGEVSFQRDIRPILSDTCFQCHGPDPESRKANLRLDVHAEATADRDGHAAIVPGNPDASALIARILSTDPDELMPPPESKKVLTPEQKELFRQWIAEGAEWPEHWAFTAPVQPAMPAVANPAWVRNPIDAFILARLEKEGLAPAPEADSTTLLRRLSLDITGLPPTAPAGDLTNEDAYGHAVDQLLSSPHFGERWARHWLDAAQFADSDGFEKDKPRQVWAWRDWVINALNNNMPYDQFVREQVAGDLLPNATQDQRVATGFLRNSMINEEGGIDPEQFRMEAIFNRMDVIGRAVMGLTVSCAQCHTHKYDPLTHTEYYQLLSYLNNSYEACMTVYTPAEENRRQEVVAALQAGDENLRQIHEDWQLRQQSWEAGVRAMPQPEWHTLDLSFDDNYLGGQKYLPRGDGSYLAAGYAPTRFSPRMIAPSPVATVTAIRLELLTDPDLPRNGPGRSIYGSGALSEFEFRMGPAERAIEEFHKWPKIEIASAMADVNTPRRALGPEYPDRDGKRKAFTGPIKYAFDGDGETAWTTDNGAGRRNQPRFVIFTLAQPLTVPEGMMLGVTLMQNHGGWNSDDNQNNNLGRIRLSVTDATALPNEAVPDSIRAIVSRDPEGRSPEEAQAVFDFWRNTEPVFAIENLKQEKLWQDYPDGATQLVYRELEQPRETHRLDRGDFLSKAEKVSPGAPAFLHPMRADAPPNRLSLAEWLTDPASPTTARTLVNRVWQHYFGTGIVASSSDFGLQGDAPSHPELLDWLAAEFMDSGWDVKALHKLIVTSATYRQASQVSQELLEKDPANRLLARGSRYRVEGEIVRDIVLAASGLLNPQVGGPSVYPPAPKFLFEPPASYGPKPWNTTDEQRYRRGLYTFRFRSVPYPALQAFDTPPGDSPCVRRLRSNTPLQALTTLNEPMFVESAEALAAKTLAEGGASDEARIAYAFQRCTSRAPQPDELATLVGFLGKQRTRVASGAITPADLLGGETDGELAAWTLTTRVLLNLDETITRE